MSPPAARHLLAVAILSALAACTDRPPGELALAPGDDPDGQPGRSAVYDFGAVKMGTTVTREVTVVNAGKGPLTLLSIERVRGDEVEVPDAPSQTATWSVAFRSGTVVPAGGRVSFPATFRPPVVGLPTSEHEVELRLAAEDAERDAATANLTLFGTGLSPDCAVPGTLDFGKLSVQDEDTLTLTIENATSLPARVTVGNITSDSIDHTAFSFPSGTVREIEVAPGGSAGVPITFRPLEPTTYSAAVAVKPGEHCETRSVTLVGTGVEGTLTWAPAQVDFQFGSPGLVLRRQVVFENVGRKDIHLSSINAINTLEFGAGTGPDAPTTELTVPAGAAAVLPVWTRPVTNGLRQTMLQFVTDAPAQPAGTIVMKVLGGGPDIETASPTVDFGKVAYFANSPTPQMRRLRVRNAGTAIPAIGAAANLRLGRTDGAGNLIPDSFFTITPANAETQSGEFNVSLPPTYDPALGIEAAPNPDFIDLVVILAPSSLGAKAAELTIHSNDPDEPAIEIALSATATLLPPCNYSLTPAALSFGMVSPPEFRDISFTIRNNATSPGDNCLISALDLAPGAHSAFSIVSGATASAELGPGQAIEVVVRMRPAGVLPSSPTSITGQVEFFVSSPVQSHRMVALNGTVGPACLVIAPDEWTFGTVALGCNSASAPFRIFSQCLGVSVNLQGIRIEGAPAADPSCATSAGCAFTLTSAPAIPAGGVPVGWPSGSSPVEFQVRSHPTAVGDAKGAVLIEVNEGGNNVVYRVPLAGKAAATGVHTDTFARPANPSADVLVAVGNSSFTASRQAALGDGFASLTQYASANQVDYRLGVISSTTNSNEGVLISGVGHQDKVITQTTVSAATKFKAKVTGLGSSGGMETPFRLSLAALSFPVVNEDNAGFLRDGADLGLVVYGALYETSPWPIASYLDALWNIKGHNAKHRFSLNAMAGIPPLAGQCFDWQSRYAGATSASNGRHEEICVANVNPGLEKIGATAFGERTRFYLTAQPDTSAGSITVKINGAVHAPPVWSHDPVSNRLTLQSAYALEAGDTLTVTYPVTCY